MQHTTLCDLKPRMLYAKDALGQCNEQVLWRGHEAFASALELVAAAEAAAGAAAAQPVGTAAAAAAAPPTEGAAPPPALPFVWRRGLVRPAASAKQAADFARATAGLPEGTGPRALTAEELRVGGLAVLRACRPTGAVATWLTTPFRTLRAVIQGHAMRAGIV